MHHDFSSDIKGPSKSKEYKLGGGGENGNTVSDQLEIIEVERE